RDLLADQQKYSLVKAFPVSAKADEKGYDSFAHQWQVRIMQPACSCHARGLQAAFQQLPGVIYAMADHDQLPTITVVYDTRKITARKLFENPSVQHLKEPTKELGDKPVASIVDVGNLVLSNEMGKPQQLVELSRLSTLEQPTDTTEVAGTTAPQVN
ncbi:MAG: hypothetical protein ACREMY_22155, partial [bacterium]